MRFKLFKNPYKQSLDASAKLLRPSEDTCDKILDSVMLAAGVTSAVSFASASAKVASMGRAAMLKTVAAVAAVTTSVSVAATAGVIMVTPPAIQDVLVEQNTWTQSSIVVKTANGAATKTVMVFPQEGTPYLATKIASGSYLVEVDNNGVYLVEVTGQGGQRVSADVAVTCIDDEMPYMDSYTVQDETVTLFFVDDQSGINWDTIYAVDSAGNTVLPLSVDAASGRIVFALPDESLDVYVEDLAGNKGKTSVDVM